MSEAAKLWAGEEAVRAPAIGCVEEDALFEIAVVGKGWKAQGIAAILPDSEKHWLSAWRAGESRHKSHTAVGSIPEERNEQEERGLGLLASLERTPTSGRLPNQEKQLTRRPSGAPRPWR